MRRRWCARWRAGIHLGECRRRWWRSLSWREDGCRSRCRRFGRMSWRTCAGRWRRATGRCFGSLGGSALDLACSGTGRGIRLGRGRIPDQRDCSVTGREGVVVAVASACGDVRGAGGAEWVSAMVRVRSSCFASSARITRGLVDFCLLAGAFWRGREPSNGKKRGPNPRPPGKWWIHIYFDCSSQRSSRRFLCK